MRELRFTLGVQRFSFFDRCVYGKEVQQQVLGVHNETWPSPKSRALVTGLARSRGDRSSKEANFGLYAAVALLHGKSTLYHVASYLPKC